MHLPFVVVRSAASFILMYILQSYFGNLVDVETIKIDDKFEVWTNVFVLPLSLLELIIGIH
jgi:hypothetical protein